MLLEGVSQMVERRVFAIRGDEKIHCASCEARIANALRRVPGVTLARADRESQQVEVQFDPRQSTEAAIQERLGQIGYTAEPVEPQ